jgi:transposase InsO family protein
MREGASHHLHAYIFTAASILARSTQPGKSIVKACKLRTKPYTPKTNGKAERFIQISLREWAYAYADENSDQRRQRLPTWLHRYNWHTPHAGIDGETPISRLALTEMPGTGFQSPF